MKQTRCPNGDCNQHFTTKQFILSTQQWTEYICSRCNNKCYIVTNALPSDQEIDEICDQYGLDKNVMKKLIE